jgi:hypothetical protein
MRRPGTVIVATVTCKEDIDTQVRPVFLRTCAHTLQRIPYMIEHAEVD